MLVSCLLRRCAGIALLEALIALTLLSGTLLGLLYMQIRALAEAENALHRAQALHLIDDLGDRIRTNPAGFAALDRYVSDWDALPTAQVDCEARWCNADQLASWDLATWKGNITRALPQGKAAIFDVVDAAGEEAGRTRRMLGVMVAWHSREGESFEISVPGASCPAGLVCQFGHVQP